MSVWWWGEKWGGIHRRHKSRSILWRAEEKGMEMSEWESWWDFVEIFAGSLGCSTPFHLNPQEVLWSRAIFNFWVFGYFHETQGQQNVWLGSQRAQNLNQVWGEVGLCVWEDGGGKGMVVGVGYTGEWWGCPAPLPSPFPLPLQASHWVFSSLPFSLLQFFPPTPPDPWPSGSCEIAILWKDH